LGPEGVFIHAHYVPGGTWEKKVVEKKKKKKNKTNSSRGGKVPKETFD